MTRYHMQDVKHVRLSLADRIDIAVMQFPGRSALLFAALMAVVVIVANII